MWFIVKNGNDVHMLAFEPSVSRHRDAEIKVSHTRGPNVICSYILVTAVAVGNRGQWCNERRPQTQAAALKGNFCSHPCLPPPSTEAKSQSRVKQLCLWDAGVCLRLGPRPHEKGQVHAGTLHFCLSTSHLCQPRREFEANDGKRHWGASVRMKVKSQMSRLKSCCWGCCGVLLWAQLREDY